MTMLPIQVSEQARFWTNKVISQFLGKPQKAISVMAWTQKEMQPVVWLIAHGKLTTDE